MSFKIKQRELNEMTERIGNECADWQDVADVLIDYLPLSILDAVYDWDETNSDSKECECITCRPDLYGEDLGDVDAVADWEIELSDDWSKFNDNVNREWVRCSCGRLDCREIGIGDEQHITAEKLVELFGPITKA